MQRIELIDLSKRFGDTLALQRAHLDAKAGEIVAICGENGAGKSTLMSLLAGSRQPSGGEILIDGQAVRIDTPHRAFDLGIRTVYQEQSLLPDVSVAENIYLGEMPRGRLGLIDWRRLHADAARQMDELGLDHIDVTRRTGSYPIATRQMLEIAKAIQFRPQLLILDEPTSVLGNAETDLLFTQMRRLRTDGAIVFYISHRLDEVLEIADRIVVLKDGETVDEMSREAATKDRLIHSMVGRALSAIFPARGTPQSEVLLKVKGLRASGVDGVSFELRKGEILGFSGLVGSGRSETVRAIFGAEQRQSGEIEVAGVPLKGRTPAAAMAAGIGFLTEERKVDGLALDAGILENAGLASMSRVMQGPFINGSAQRALVLEKVRELDVRPQQLGHILRRMSGGNQQKVVLAKWLLMEKLRVLILDEPTRGVDIAAKVEIYRLIAALAAEGIGIVMISSELPEILGLAHRIVVMREGRIVGERNPETTTEHEIFRLATDGEGAVAA
jgi:ribose transport system ATP-binding protein